MKIKSVKAIKDTHLLNVVFEDEKNYIVDMYDEIYRFLSMADILDRKKFEKVEITGYGFAISWDDIDYDSIELRKLAEKQQKTIKNIYSNIGTVLNNNLS